MTAESGDTRDRGRDRDISIPRDAIGSTGAQPTEALSLTSIVPNTRNLSGADKQLLRTALSPGRQEVVQGLQPVVNEPIQGQNQARIRRALSPDSSNTFASRDRLRPNTLVHNLNDRVTLSRQLARALRQGREVAETSRKQFAPARSTEVAAAERAQADRDRTRAQQTRNVEVAQKRARALVALIKTNPEAMAKLEAILSTAQGQNIPEIFASILVEKNAQGPGDNTATRATSISPDVQLAASTAGQLAAKNPEFAAKLGQAIVQQMAMNQSDSQMPIETVKASGEQLAQVLSEPNNRVLAEAVVKAALTEPQVASNTIVIQELAKADPTIVERYPQVAEVARTEPIAIAADTRNIQVASADLSAPILTSRPIQLASMTGAPDYAGVDNTTGAVVVQPLNITSYTMSAEIPQRIDDLRHIVKNYSPIDASLTAGIPYEIPAIIDAGFRQAVQSEVYTNPTSSMLDIRDSLNQKLGVDGTSKFSVELQNSGGQDVLALVPTQTLIQERPEVSTVRIPVVTQAEIQSTQVEVQKLEKFISDINTVSDASMASQFAEFAKNSTRSLNTVLAFRQVIMAIAKNSGLSGRDLAQRIKDELNLGLSGSGLSVETEADSVLLNTVSEGLNSTVEQNLGPTLVKVDFAEVPGVLTTEEIERLKTEMVASVYDPLKLASIEQKLIANGVSQDEINDLKAGMQGGSDGDTAVTDAVAIARIRNDVQGLISRDSTERRNAAEDLFNNNISILSANDGALAISIERQNQVTSISVWVPGENAGDPPTTVELYSYGPNESDNRTSPELDGLLSVMSETDWKSIKLDIIDEDANAISVPGVGESIQPAGESLIQIETGTPVLPPFNPYDYIDPSQVQSPPELNIPAEEPMEVQEEYEEEQYQDQEQEQEQDQEQETFDQEPYEDEVQDEYQEQEL